MMEGLGILGRKGGLGRASQDIIKARHKRKEGKSFVQLEK